MTHVRSSGRGLLGTWVKIPSLEVVQLLANAGFDLVVIDLEHSAIDAYRAVELIFAAQATGMAAVVRLPDSSASHVVQPLLDGGADGLLVPRITSLSVAAAIGKRMVFGPAGERGLGLTSRAGMWGLGARTDYIARGDRECLRMLQLEDWDSLERAAEFAAVEHINGIFIGHGDLHLSSGKSPWDPEVQILTKRVLQVAKDAHIISGAAASTPEDAKRYLAMGFSIVMVSNDATMFGVAAADAVKASRG